MPGSIGNGLAELRPLHSALGILSLPAISLSGLGDAWMSNRSSGIIYERGRDDATELVNLWEHLGNGTESSTIDNTADRSPPMSRITS
jgi:hypothetical protein